MRWVASISWVAIAAWAFSQFLSDSFKQVEELGPSAIYLGAAALIAIGGRIGLVGATVGVGFAGLLTVAALAFTQWLMVLAFAALTIVKFLAMREMRTPRQPG